MRLYVLSPSFEGPLDIKGHTAPTRVPPLHKCKNLFVMACPGLTRIPAIRPLIHLDCSNCNELSEIPQMPKLQSLFCFQCMILKEIPLLENLRKIDCSRCASITQIAPSRKLSSLNCCLCYSLTAIPPVENLKYLCCADCPLITEIPSLKKLETLEFARCKWLHSIPSKFPVEDKIGCPCLKGSPDYDSSVMEQVIQLQRWYKKLYFWKRLLRFVNSQFFLKLYYKPGRKGHWLSVKKPGLILDAI